MEPFWTAVLKTFLGAGVPIAALLAALGNFKLNRMTSASAGLLEVAKHENATALEAIRTELRTYAYRQEVQFSRLHEKRLALIGDLYALAWDVQGDLQMWMNEMGTVLVKPGEEFDEALERQSREHKHAAVSGLNALIKLAGRNSLYLPDDVAERVQTIAKHMKTAEFKFTAYVAKRATPQSEKAMDKMWESQDTAREMVRDQLDAMLGELRRDFKALLEPSK